MGDARQGKLRESFLPGAPVQCRLEGSSQSLFTKGTVNLKQNFLQTSEECSITKPIQRAEFKSEEMKEKQTLALVFTMTSFSLPDDCSNACS